MKRVVEFGAFVELGVGLDGLIPRSEISWQRNARPEDYLKSGETVAVSAAAGGLGRSTGDGRVGHLGSTGQQGGARVTGAAYITAL